MTKTNITAFIWVYNEEERIASCLKNLSWVDKIIVFDKNSNDGTREIARRYKAEVILVPYGEASENVINDVSPRITSEWCFFPTASTLIHPKLAAEIIKLTSDPNFSYDVIGMPLGFYSLGIRNKHSPFGSARKHTLIRKSALVLSTKLHHEISYNSKNIFNMPFINDDAVLYHCTHRNIESYISQISRYTKYESENDRNLTPCRAFKDILMAFFHVLIRRNTFVIGWDGLALSITYITYFFLRFLYVWEKGKQSGDLVYSELREKLDREWNDSL